MSNFATVDDLIKVYGKLNAEQTEKANELLGYVSNYFRYLAKEYNRDLDLEIAGDEIIKSNAKLATINVVVRELEKKNSSLSQESQSALGYTWSGSYVNTGGGLSVLNKDLKLLGLNMQKVGLIDVYGF